MKRTYRINIRADKYPTEYIVEASQWHTAISRAVREWKKRFKGSRANKLSIIALKGIVPVLKEENND